MGRRSDACPGKCNRRYRQAWDNWEQAYEAWIKQCTAKATLADRQFPDDPAGRAAIVRDLKLPAPPATPDNPVSVGDPIWCERCKAIIAKALARLDDLASLLESWQDGHRGASSGESGPRRGAEPGSPSPISDILDKLYGELIEVEDQWRRLRSYPPRPRRARDGRARRHSIAFLSGELRDILTSKTYVEFGKRVLAWERLLYTLSRSEPVVRPVPGRCPRCRYKNVLATRDDGRVQCRRSQCNRLLSQEEYDELVDAELGVDAEQEMQVS
jgi:hypothetical protein